MSSGERCDPIGTALPWAPHDPRPDPRGARLRGIPRRPAAALDGVARLDRLPADRSGPLQRRTGRARVPGDPGAARARQEARRRGADAAADGAGRAGRRQRRRRLAGGHRTVKRGLVVYYVSTLAVFGAGIAFVLLQGRRLEAAHPGTPASAAAAAPHPGVLEALRHPLPLLLVQLILVVVAARALGALFHRFGQPPVIGEIVAGILLGPSFLGAFAPGVFETLFPASAAALLKLFAEIGVLLFLFAVGLELDVDRLRGSAQTAIVVSHASIVAPYFLGVGAALFLYAENAPPGVRFTPFALFMGIAMSITAFPV